MKYMMVLMVAITVLVGGCDWFDKIDDVEFESDYAVEYDVSVTNDSVKLDQLLTLTSDSEVEKYQDKLQKITVDSVVLRVSNYNSSASTNLLSGSVMYSESTSNNPIDFASFSNFAISEGASTKLTPSNAKMSEIQSILLSQKAIKVYIRGKATSAADFTLKAYFYFTVKADALK